MSPRMDLICHLKIHKLRHRDIHWHFQNLKTMLCTENGQRSENDPYGFHQFGVVSGPLLLKTGILGHFGPPKRVLGSQGLTIFTIWYDNDTKVS